MPHDPYIYTCAIFGDFHDPLAVRRALFQRSAGQINQWLVEQRGTDVTIAFAAHDKLLPVIREVFGLPLINRATGDGVSDQSCINVLNAFLRWLEGKE